MILQTVLVFLFIAAVIAIGEAFIHFFHRDNEASRKLVHIAHGSGLAILAFIVPLSAIIIFESIFLAGMFLARYLHTHFDKEIKWVHYLGKMYRVGRLSYGDLFFPISAMAAAVLADSKWEFAAVILVLGLADAAAALIGKKYGQATSYLVFGQRKSLIGTIAFFVVSYAVICGYMALSGVVQHDINWLAAAGIAAILTLTENLGVYGSDNLLIPLVGVVVLNLL